MKYPQKILQDHRCQLWLKREKNANLSSIVQNTLRCGMLLENTRSIAMSIIFTNALENILDEEIDGDEGKCIIYSAGDAICIKIDGVNDTIKFMLNKAVSKLANFELTGPEFTAKKIQTIEKWKAGFTSVEGYGDELFSSIFWEKRPPSAELIDAANNITRTELILFVKKFCQNCWIQGLIHGDFTKKEAAVLFKSSLATLKLYETYNSNPTPDIGRHLQPPATPHVIKRTNLNSNDGANFEKWFWYIGEVSIQEQMRLLI